MAGFRVIFLGADVPAEDVAEFVANERADMVVLSASTTLAFSGLRSTVAHIRERLGNTFPIAVGGRAFLEGDQCAIPGLIDAGRTVTELVTKARRVTDVHFLEPPVPQPITAWDLRPRTGATPRLESLPPTSHEEHLTVSGMTSPSSEQLIADMSQMLGELVTLHRESDRQKHEIETQRANIDRLHKELKDSESALRESNARFRLVGRATNDVVWDWDLRTNMVAWNSAADVLFKLAPNQIHHTATWWYERIHPTDRARVEAGLHAVIQGDGENWVEEYRLLRGDGTYATVLDRGYVVHNEVREPVRMVGSMLDITERTRTEHALQFLGDASAVLAGSLHYETTLKSLVRLAVPRMADWCIVYMVDQDGAIRPLEVAALDSEEETRLWDIQRRYPINPASRTDAVARVVRGGPGEIITGGVDRYYDDDAPALISDATPPASSLVVPLRARGHSLGALVLTSTSPERRYSREQLRVAQDLADRAALAVDNAKLYETAIVASRAKSDFLGVISHELRTPLNAILGYSDLLQLDIVGVIPDSAKEYLDRVRVCAKHLLTLIEQILIVSRMDSGHDERVSQLVRVQDVVYEAGMLVGPLASEKGLSFEIIGDVPNMTLRSDGEKISQVLLALPVERYQVHRRWCRDAWRPQRAWARGIRCQ